MERKHFAVSINVYFFLFFFFKESVVQSCLTPCNPMDDSLPGSSVHGIFQARILPFPIPGDLPDPGMEPASLVSPASTGGFFTISITDIGVQVSLYI